MFLKKTSIWFHFFYHQSWMKIIPTCFFSFCFFFLIRLKHWFRYWRYTDVRSTLLISQSQTEPAQAWNWLFHFSNDLCVFIFESRWGMILSAERNTACLSCLFHLCSWCAHFSSKCDKVKRKDLYKLYDMVLLLSLSKSIFA